MKPVAIFFSEQTENKMFDVFDSVTISILQEILDLPQRVYLHSELEKERELFSRTRFLFSTWGMPILTEEEIRRFFPSLEAVFYAAGSVQSFARPFLHCGVKVFSAWAANAVPVAEYTVSQIILANKGFYQATRRMKSGEYDKAHTYCASFPGSYDTHVGILGAGMIGSAVLERLKEYRLSTWVYDPFVSDEKLAGLGAKRASLEEIFSQCQVISNHIANLPTTQKILRYEHFSRMHPNAVFLNTGRGAQVVEEDLIQALNEEPSRTAVLDVTDPEPPIDESPLWNMENVFLTPHLAGSWGQEVTRMGTYMAEEFSRFIANKPLRWEVTEKLLETMA